MLHKAHQNKFGQQLDKMKWYLDVQLINNGAMLSGHYQRLLGWLNDQSCTYIIYIYRIPTFLQIRVNFETTEITGHAAQQP